MERQSNAQTHLLPGVDTCSGLRGLATRGFIPSHSSHHHRPAKKRMARRSNAPLVWASIAACVALRRGVSSFETSSTIGNAHRALGKPIRQPSSVVLRSYDDWYIEDEAIGDGATLGDSRESADGDEGKDNRVYFATCIPGLEQALAGELVEIGAKRVQAEGRSGVRFEGSPLVGLKALVYSRTMHKLLELVASSAVHQPDSGDDYGYQDFSRGIRTSRDLYDFVQSNVHVPSLLGDGKGGLLTMSVGTIYSGRPPKELSHTHYTALTVKNSIVDLVRDLRDDGERPDVDIVCPDVPLILFVNARRQFRSRNWETEDSDVDIAADVDLYRCLHSSGSLHKRGYRADDSGDATAPIHRAAMKESLAAGLLLEAGWGKLVNDARGNGRGAVLLDPMTGSATFPVEAALIAGDVAPALVRIASWRGRGPNPHASPSFLKWKDFTSEETWNELIARATQRAKVGLQWAQSETVGGCPSVKILCNEQNPGAADLAASSIKKAGVSNIISLHRGDCIDWHLEDDEVIEGRTMVVSNPPWGIRLTEEIDTSWVNLREFLRREAGGTEAWILSGNPALTKILRMKKSRSVCIKTGEQDLRFLKYSIFAKKPVDNEVMR